MSGVTGRSGGIVPRPPIHFTRSSRAEFAHEQTSAVEPRLLHQSLHRIAHDTGFTQFARKTLTRRYETDVHT